jgi:hypothetical protein
VSVNILLTTTIEQTERIYCFYGILSSSIPSCMKVQRTRTRCGLSLVMDGQFSVLHNYSERNHDGVFSPAAWR